MKNETPSIEASTAEGQSALPALLDMSTPWHIGFGNEIADMLRPTGDWHPDLVRYQVVQVCDYHGRHVCWAKSPEHAAMIVESVNLMSNGAANRMAATPNQQGTDEDE